MIVIGIDPGTTTIGYAIIESNKNKKVILDYGIIHTKPKIELKFKLLEVSKDLGDLINKYKPERAVVEKLFFTTNLKTGIDVSHVRGLIIYLLAKNNLDILEYTPLELKSAICGNGKATKLQIQKALKIFFELEDIPKPDDASDALGLAYMGILKKNLLF